MENSGFRLAVNEDELAAFIGGKAQKYLPKFRKFSIDGIDRFSATWHWPVPFSLFSQRDRSYTILSFQNYFLTILVVYNSIRILSNVFSDDNNDEK